MIPIDPRKYRSEEQRVRLEQAARMLLVEATFQDLLGKKSFTRLRAFRFLPDSRRHLLNVSLEPLEMRAFPVHFSA